MMGFLKILILSIGMMAVLFGVIVLITYLWTQFTEALKHRREITDRMVALLEKIESNTAQKNFDSKSD